MGWNNGVFGFLWRFRVHIKKAMLDVKDVQVSGNVSEGM